MNALLFPPEPRTFPGRRALKITLRAAHVLCAGVLVGAHLLDGGAGARHAWLWATVATGAAILVLDLHESAAFLLQVRGAVVLLKLLLLALLPFCGGAQGWVLAGILAGSVVSSHAPASFRHRVLLGGVRGAETRG